MMMEINVTVDINLVGISNNKAIIIPLQIYGKIDQNNSDDFGVDAVGAALAKELPYIKYIVCRLFPEMNSFLKNMQLQLKTDIDSRYDCEVTDTASAQLPLALSLCMLLRKSFGLPILEDFVATGILDPLGFIIHVEDMLVKRLAVQNTLFIQPSDFSHIFDVLKTINCLITR